MKDMMFALHRWCAEKNIPRPIKVEITFPDSYGANLAFDYLKMECHPLAELRHLHQGYGPNEGTLLGTPLSLTEPKTNPRCDARAKEKI